MDPDIFHLIQKAAAAMHAGEKVFKDSKCISLKTCTSSAKSAEERDINQRS